MIRALFGAVGATLRAANTGMELLNEAAIEFEKATANLAMESRIRLLERELQRPAFYMLANADVARKQQELLGLYTQLARARGDSAERELQTKKTKLEADIATFESERWQVEDARYPCGQRKMHCTTYDGEYQGLCQLWYENGRVKAEVPFTNGKIDGEVSVWCEAGELLFRGQFEAGGRRVMEIFINNGQRIADIDAVGNNDRVIKMRVWLWDGTYIGRISRRKGRVRKRWLVLQVLLKPWLWIIIWKAGTSDAGKAGMAALEQRAELFESVMTELKLMEI